MEKLEMTNEMWLKIENRVAARIKKVVANPAYHEDLLSGTCISFLDKFSPVEAETGRIFTENEAVFYAMNAAFTAALRAEEIMVRTAICSKGTLQKALDDSPEEAKKLSRDIYQPVVRFESIDEETEGGLTLQGMIYNVDPMNPMGYDERICEAFESPDIDDLTKKIMAMKLEDYSNEEVGKKLGITKDLVLYKLQCVKVKLGYVKTVQDRKVRPVGEKWEGKLTFASSKKAANELSLAA